MKNRKKILVILGGNSRERNISLETGKSCIFALNKVGYQTIKFDPKKNSLNNIKKINPDVIFNALLHFLFPSTQLPAINMLEACTTQYFGQTMSRRQQHRHRQ